MDSQWTEEAQLIAGCSQMWGENKAGIQPLASKIRDFAMDMHLKKAAARVQWHQEWGWMKAVRIVASARLSFEAPVRNSQVRMYPF
jgi:hypothetical protein